MPPSDNQHIFNDWWERWSIFLVFIAACLLIPKSGVVEAGDNTAQYMGEALRLVQGRPLAFEIMRGPGFPGLIAFFFTLFGESVKSTFIAVRVCHALCILVMMLLAKRLFGTAVAVLAGILALTSFALNGASVWMTPDIPLALCLLTMFWALSYGLGDGFKLHMGIAGFAYGLACLTKEHALLFLPSAPLALWYFRASKKQFVVGLLLFYGFWAIVYGPWVYYFTVVRGISWDGLLGFVSPQFAAHSTDKIIGKRSTGGTVAFLFEMFLLKGPIGLRDFYNYALKACLVGAPMFVAAWINVIFRARKNNPFRFLTVATGLFLPLIVATGLHRAGIRQVAVIYYLTYIAFAVSAFQAGEFISKYVFRRFPSLTFGHAERMSFLAVLCLLTSMQLFGGTKSTAKLFVKGSTVDGMEVFPWRPWFPKDFKVLGPHRKEMEEISTWIKANLEPGQPAFLLSRHPQGFHLFLGFDFFIEQPLPHRCKRIEGCRGFPDMDAIQPAFMATYAKFKNKFERYRNITFYDANEVVNVLVGSRYVSVNTPSLEERFLNKLSETKKLASFGNIALYEVTTKDPEALRKKSLALLKQDPIVNEEMNDHLVWLRREYPAEYTFFVENFGKHGVSLPKLAHLE